MPKPNKGEKKNDYISRCVVEVMKEGKTKDQAVGKCEGMWKGYMSNNMEHITINLDTGNLRKETMDGKVYLVAPMVLMTVGVHNGSKGPLLYPDTELSKWSPSWNHKPLIVYHPKNKTASADAKTLKKSKLGFALNVSFDDKQRGEAWFDEEVTKIKEPRIINALYRKEKMELSTGLIVDRDETPGEFQGKKYDAIAINHRPDHIAILPDQIGACSIKDGGGLNTLNEMSHESIRMDLCMELTEYYQDQMDKMPSLYSPYVRAVFDDSCIFSFGGNLYEVGYSTLNDEASLVGEPTQVEEEVKYVPIGNSLTEENSMAKKDLVDKIIANTERTNFEESDRKHLDAMDEKRLEKIMKVAENTKAKDDAEAKKKADEDAAAKKKIDDDKETVKNKEGNKTVENTAKPVTDKEWLDTAPPGIKSVVLNAIHMENTEKQRLIGVITNNETAKQYFKAEDLALKGIPELRALAALSAPAVENADLQTFNNYFGAGAPVVANQHKEEALDIPVYNYSQKQTEKV